MAPRLYERCSGEELRGVLYLAALEGLLEKYSPILEDRLKAEPDAWRQFRIAQSGLNKLLPKLYESMAPKDLIYIDKTLRSGNLMIEPKKATKSGEVQFVLTDDLKFLVARAIENDCFFCDKDKSGIKKCDLRKALLYCMPPEHKTEKGVCPYAEVAKEVQA